MRPRGPAGPTGLVLSAFLLALSSGCTDRGAGDLVVITIDTLRADRLGCYGNDSGLTPVLDRFAQGSVRFADATAVTPLTLPSHCSIFTGRYPTATGVRNNGAFVLPEGEATLAETLREAGWKTGAVIGSYPLHGRYGLSQGFDLYDDALPETPPPPKGQLPIFYAERDAREVTDRALAVWRRLEGSPRLLWVHYFDPHSPYAAPEPWSTRHPGHPYDGEIAYVDAELGRLLRNLDAEAPEAVVAILADHGESLGEHGEQTHGVFLYQSTLHVPLMIRAPGLPAGRTVSTPVSLTDVMPTLLGLAGVDQPRGIEGSDLRRLIEGESAPRGRPVYAESYLPRLQFRFHELTMIRRGSLKFIEAPTPELYDVRQDPRESSNLHGGHPDEDPLAAELAEWTASTDPAVSERAAGALDPETEAKLRSLGYTAAGSLAPVRTGTARDPKTMLDYLAKYDRAVGLIALGRRDEGIAILRALLPLAPENYMARYQVAAGLLSSGRLSEAEAELAQVVDAAPEFSNGYLMLAETQARQGEYDDAIRSYQAAASTAPSLAWPHAALGGMLEGIGRFEEAAGAYLRAIHLEPHDAGLPRRLLALRVGRGERARAVDELTRLAEAHPRATMLQVFLATALRQMGRSAEASARVDRALALDPTRAEAWVLRGELALDSKRASAAESAFREAVLRNPDSVEAHFGLARTLLAAGRTLESEAAFGQVLRLDPRFSPAHTVRGLYFERMGRTSDAVDSYRRAVAVNGADKAAWDGLRRLRQAR